MALSGSKTCANCKIEKSLNSFTMSNRSKDGKDSYCKECKKVKAKMAYTKNPEKVIGYSKKWQRLNREQYLESRKVNNKKTADLRREWGYQKDFGITIADYDEMYILQSGCCAICGTHQSKLPKRLAVDHCHETRKVRGLLCSKCNIGIGFLDDSVQILRNAITYLEMAGE